MFEGVESCLEDFDASARGFADDTRSTAAAMGREKKFETLASKTGLGGGKLAMHAPPALGSTAFNYQGDGHT